MSDWKVGDRVRIPAVMWPKRQPNPQHVNKLGTITGTETMQWGNDGGQWFDVPIITLDDGSVLLGWMCWWERIDNPEIS